MCMCECMYICIRVYLEIYMCMIRMGAKEDNINDRHMYQDPKDNAWKIEF